MNYNDYYIKEVINEHGRISAIYIIRNSDGAKFKINDKKNLRVFEVILKNFKQNAYGATKNIRIYEQTREILDRYFKQESRQDTKKVANGITKKIRLALFGTASILILYSVKLDTVSPYNNKVVTIKKNNSKKVKHALKNNEKLEKKATTEAKKTSFDREDNDKVIDFNFYCDSRVDFGDLAKTRRYKNIFNTCGNIYGIDPNLLIAQATQESGGDISVNFNQPDIGIMQIEWEAWVGEKISAYNYKTRKFDTVKITKDNLCDLDSHIKIATMILQSNINATYEFGYKLKKVSEEDILAYSLQRYNMGAGTMIKLLNMGGNWKNNRDYFDIGDPEYFENVMNNLDNNSTVWFNSCFKGKVEKHFVRVNNISKKKKR